MVGDMIAQRTVALLMFKDGGTVLYALTNPFPSVRVRTVNGPADKRERELTFKLIGPAGPDGELMYEEF